MTRMATTYNQIAGKSLDRLTSLSDNIFAVAMTLLVLNLHIPDEIKISNERDFLVAIKSLVPRLMTYSMSFLTLGIYWIGQHTQHDQLERSNRHYAWLNLLLLAGVTLIPFSTSLLARYIHFRSALVIYWVNLMFLGLTVLVAWSYARIAHLQKSECSEVIHRAYLFRICSSVVLYTGAILLSIPFSTDVSIGLIILIQLNYAIAPKLFFRPKVNDQD